MEKLFNNRKILIVEDDTETIRLLENIFAVLGFSVETAFNGHEGLEKVSNNNYDLILTDINMPIMNGFDMINKINSTNKSNKIIVMSSYTSEKVLKTINNKKIKVLSKPFNLTELIDLAKKTILI